jgi:glycine cleavage system H protein
VSGSTHGTGTVIEANADLSDAPERLNDDPYGDGWICVIQPDDLSELSALLDAEAYRRLIES